MCRGGGAHGGGKVKLLNNFIISSKSHFKMTNITTSMELFYFMYKVLVQLNRIYKLILKIQPNIG